jgi:putative intracellular protease/amidase
VGFWAAELFHPLYEFSKVRYEVTVASPDGGRVEIDALSDPRDDSTRAEVARLVIESLGI